MSYRAQVFHAESGFYFNANHQSEDLEELKTLVGSGIFDGFRYRVVDEADNEVQVDHVPRERNRPGFVSTCGSRSNYFCPHPRARAKVREALPYGQRASCGGLRAGLLSVLHGLGGDCDGTFGAEFEPVLEVFLLLGNDGCGHLTAPRVRGNS